MKLNMIFFLIATQQAVDGSFWVFRIKYNIKKGEKEKMFIRDYELLYGIIIMI